MKSNTPALAALDLNLLVALDLLLDERSVRGAARRAGVTPSAMSHSLARLRALLGDELLVRAGRDLVATPRALALAEPVALLLDGARRLLLEEAPFDPAILARPFRLVCTDHVSTVLLPGVDALLRREAPGVDLYVLPLTPETMDDLRKGTVDAVIGVFPEAPPEVRARRLFDDRFVTVGRAGHSRLAGRPLDLAAFLAEEHALVAPRGVPVGTVDEVLAADRRSRRVARTFPSFLAALWYTTTSDALLTVSERLVSAIRPSLPLEVWAPPLDLPGYTLVLAWHPRLDQAPEHRWFRGLLGRAAEALPPLSSRAPATPGCDEAG